MRGVRTCFYPDRQPSDYLLDRVNVFLPFILELLNLIVKNNQN
jgi:hypothetical protein